MIRRIFSTLWAFARFGNKAFSLSIQAEQNAANVAALVRSSGVPEVVEHIHAGRLSLVDVRFGILSPADRIAEHNDALAWRALHSEGVGSAYKV